MKPILPELYTWSVFNAEKRLNFNGLLLRTAHRFILIDPPAMTEADIEIVESFGKPSRILLTNKHHTRAAAEHRERWGAKLYIHEADAPLMEIPVDGTYVDGEILWDELQAIHIPDAKTPGECAFLWEKNAAMIVGDALLGKPAGGLSMLSDNKFKNPAAARQGLHVLRAHKFDMLLVGDGESILSQGKAALEKFLEGL